METMIKKYYKIIILICICTTCIIFSTGRANAGENTVILNMVKDCNTIKTRTLCAKSAVADGKKTILCGWQNNAPDTKGGCLDGPDDKSDDCGGGCYPITGNHKEGITITYMRNLDKASPCTDGNTCASNQRICRYNPCYGVHFQYYEYGLGFEMTGWDTDPDCKNSRTLDEVFSGGVTTDITIYACWGPAIGVVEDYAYVTDSSATLTGPSLSKEDKIFVTRCYQEWGDKDYARTGVTICEYSSINGQSATGTANEKYLLYATANEAEEYFDISSGTQINEYKYITQEFELIRCGAAVYVNSCNNGKCLVEKFKNLVDSDIHFRRQISETLFVDSEQEAQKICNNNPANKNTSTTTTMKITGVNTTSTTTKKENNSNKLTCNNKENKLSNVTGANSLLVCYDKTKTDEEIKNMIIDDKLVSCANGYTVDKNSIIPNDAVKCDNKNCERYYLINCTRSTVQKPTLSTTPGIVSNNGLGVVTVNTYTSGTEVTDMYLSEILSTPTSNSEWTAIENSNFEISGPAGTQYIWVKDNEQQISNVATISVIDNINTDTTIKYLELSDGTNNVIPEGVAYQTNYINGYALLSNNNSKTLIAKGFDQFTHEYKINVDSPTITVYATLTSKDSSYVDGYGPRTVNLKYGTNTVLIKIKNKDGKIRTYTIIATRNDNRNSDNTLYDISLNVGKIDFNANKTEYKIEIPTKTDLVNVYATLNSDLSTFVRGYEPGIISIDSNITTKLLKVQSQTGSIRTYVLTFVKDKSDIIEDESLQLFSLSIPNVNLAFEPTVANYNLSVGYETDTIDIYAILKSNNGNLNIKMKKGNKYNNVKNLGINLAVGENNFQIVVGNEKGDYATYYLTIIRKEFGLEISNDTTLKDLQVLGYDIKFDKTKKDYSVKIKTEKSLVITAVPNNNRSEVFIRGNEELTGFSTVRIKVVAENGDYATYSIDIKKDPFNKTVEIAAIIVGGVLILGASYIIFIKNKTKKEKDYYRE